MGISFDPIETLMSIWRNLPPDQVKEAIAIRATIEVMQKQRPKAPDFEGVNPDGTERYSCFNCGYLWWERAWVSKYCPSCGQKTSREWEKEANDEK